MLKIKIYSVGKTKESWLEDALEEYLKRLSPYMQIETLWAREDEHLIAILGSTPAIALDPLGKEYDSPAFSRFLFQQFEKQGSRLTFVIGGPEGLPRSLKEHAMLISLSKLTFTHQITRLVLLEQLYRAQQIQLCSPYHK